MGRPSDPGARALAEPIEIVDYDLAWPARFAEEAARLRDLLPPGTIGRVEHIGSTAVPGLAGKPIVDLMVEVPDYATVAARIAPILTAAGYEYFWRPVEPGLPEVAYAWFIRRDAAGRRTHHVHMAPAGAPWWDRLVFRDWLRAHPEAAADYAALKRRAVARHPGDRRAYASAKAGFIRAALAAAAARGG